MNKNEFKICDKVIRKINFKIFKLFPQYIIKYVFGSKEDLYQQGWIFACNNIKKIKDNNIGIFYLAIYYDMYDYIRKVCGKNNSFKNKSIQKIINLPNNFNNLYYYNDKYIFNYIIIKEIQCFINKKLSDKELSIFYERYYMDKQLKEIAKKYSVSESRINQILNEINNVINNKFKYNL